MKKKITLMEAYLIETLRANEIEDEEIIEKVKEKKVKDFQHINEKFDFTALYDLHEQGILEEVLKEGYEIKFLTFTGLVNLLRIKFNRHENEDFKVKDYTIEQLQLDHQELETLQQLVSSNWQITKEASGIKIKPIASL